jgi:hypothetical protein
MVYHLLTVTSSTTKPSQQYKSTEDKIVTHYTLQDDKIPYQSDSYDELELCLDTIPNNTLLAECNRVLKKGGVFRIVDKKNVSCVLQNVWLMFCF